MSCSICNRSSCCESFHSVQEQEQFEAKKICGHDDYDEIKEELEFVQIEAKEFKKLYKISCEIYDVLKKDNERLRTGIDTIANPRRGTPEEHWDVGEIGDFARDLLVK